GVVEPERHPAEGLVVSPVDGREHPVELAPGQAPIARVVGEVEVVVPEHEVVAQGGQETGGHHERDPRRNHPGGGCGTTAEGGRAPRPERKCRSRVPRASDQSSTAVLHGARPPVVAASTIWNRRSPPSRATSRRPLPSCSASVSHTGACSASRSYTCTRINDGVLGRNASRGPAASC